MKSHGAFGGHTRMRIGGFRLTCIKKYDRSDKKARYRGKGLFAQFASFHYGWSTVFGSSRRFSTMPLFYRGYIGTAGRRTTINMPYGFLGLITSQNPHIPHIYLVA